MCYPRPLVSTLFALAGILVTALPLPAAAETRMALIFGNRDYRHLPPVKTAINDAQAMATMLKRAPGQPRNAPMTAISLTSPSPMASRGNCALRVLPARSVTPARGITRPSTVSESRLSTTSWAVQVD